MQQAIRSAPAPHVTPRHDARPRQIATLGALLAYGVLALDFEVDPQRAALLLTSALASEWLLSRLWGAQRFDPRSPLISGLGLSLLLRTQSDLLAVVAAVLAIGSKYLLRWRGRHVWNPTCFAIVFLLAATDSVWVSAGQWGSGALFGLAAAGLGSRVVYRAERSDVTWAFLGFHAALLAARAVWLGDPWQIPLHQLRSGALLVFAFHMISDPKTLPASRAGRIVFAGVVALAGYYVAFRMFHTNALLWSLACAAPLVPLFDFLLPAARYEWTPRTHARTNPEPPKKENSVKRWTRRLARPATLVLLVTALLQGEARAFCGFYVAKADTKLFNKASQVVLVRDGDRTVITMSNDFRGDPKEFAMVIPVPTFVTREQIHVGERGVLEHLDAYTSPRLVEYFDPDPCTPRVLYEAFPSAARALDKAAPGERESAEGVVIEAAYTVGEFDILILSASQSDGLATWLRRNAYHLPDGAEQVLGSYIRQNMRFFVARVNLEEQSKLGFSYLRPLQVAYESQKFMLPIRLGTLNADGPQELFLYALTRRGRVETTNYRTVKLPTDVELPVYVKGEFGEFYTALFDEQVRREQMQTVFTEYAWDMNWCDPCAADPLSPEELRSLGVFWLDPGQAGPARDVFVTRLHVRYDAESFPADLVFQETADRSNFQGRYVLRHPYEGEARCPAAEAYRRELRERREREARALASLTGWSLAEIRRRIGLGLAGGGGGEEPWWQRLWGQ
jgi:hypothetical protein